MSKNLAQPVAVTVNAEVARTASNDAGTRNVLIDPGGEKTLLTFSRVPTYLRRVPPEVADDKQLIVGAVTFSEIVDAGGRFTLLPGEEAPTSLELDGEPEELKIDELRQIAATHGLDSEGDKNELLTRINGYFRAHGVTLKAERVQ